MQPRFEGRTIIVTGAGTGMGRAAALRLAQEGARTILVGRRPEPLESLATDIAEAGGTALAIPCDLTDAQAVAAMVRQAQDDQSRIHGIFANAGVLGRFKPLAETEATDFDTLIATNLLGTHESLRACLPHLAGGAVVINASWTAGSVMPGAGAYAATKGALIALMHTLAVEQGPRAIRVNSISPGIILTPMAEAALDPAIATRLAAQAPLGRNGTPQDVAGAVAWLLSDDAIFVTGQDIVIDGGFTIGGPRL